MQKMALLIALTVITGHGGLAAWRLWCGRRLRSWPTTEGIIEASAVSKRSMQMGSAWEPNVQYRYTVDGVLHVGKRIAFRPLLKTRARSADRITALYPVGSRTVVHYDPRSPSRSALMPGTAFADVLFALLGIGAAPLLALEIAATLGI